MKKIPLTAEVDGEKKVVGHAYVEYVEEVMTVFGILHDEYKGIVKKKIGSIKGLSIGSEFIKETE